MTGRQNLLVAVLASPPRTTSGNRTRARVDLAGQALGFDSTLIVNLLHLPTSDVTEISILGVDADSWLASRKSIDRALLIAGGVLAAWGQSEPTGAARGHQRRQVEWLQSRISSLGLRSWTVGGTPRHPSRWQRITHSAYPHETFALALGKALQPS